MIELEYLVEKLRVLKTLMQAQITKEFAQEAHARIKYFDTSDLDRAIEKMLNTPEHSRVTFPSLLKCLNEARAIRHDRESQQRQERDRKADMMFWDRHRELASEPCTARNCGSCPPDNFLYCNDMAVATCRTIRKKFNSENAFWSISARLANEFPGAGFDTVRPTGKWVIVKKDGTMVSASGPPEIDETKQELDDWQREWENG